MSSFILASLAGRSPEIDDGKSQEKTPRDKPQGGKIPADYFSSLFAQAISAATQ